jgi:hypothetical protein
VPWGTRRRRRLGGKPAPPIWDRPGGGNSSGGSPPQKHQHSRQARLGKYLGRVSVEAGPNDAALPGRAPLAGGLVAKRQASAYRSGPSRDWVKTKTAAWALRSGATRHQRRSVIAPPLMGLSWLAAFGRPKTAQPTGRWFPNRRPFSHHASYTLSLIFAAARRAPITWTLGSALSSHLAERGRRPKWSSDRHGRGWQIRA